MQLPSLLDSGRIVFPLAGPTLSVRESARRCPHLGGFEFPLSLRHFLNTPTPECPFRAGVRLQLKLLQHPKVSISTMVRSMIIFYRIDSVRVEVVSREDLQGPAFATLLDLDVGPCTSNQALAAEQTQLYQNRNNVNNNIDIAVYFVRQVLENGTDALNGCAAPTQTTTPSVAIAQIASRWTLAHEVGHKLGLNHIAGESCPPPEPPTRLMTGCGTGTIITDTPTLTRTEQDTMLESVLIQNF
jgi:hypothetical protein